jgi:hypothetical protein
MNKRFALWPVINGFSLGSDNRYNEFQSDSSANDNTANATNSNLKTIINNKLAALNLSGYNTQMIISWYSHYQRVRLWLYTTLKYPTP